MWILILYIYNKLCRIRQTCCSSRACRQLWYSLNKNSPEVKMRNFPAASLNVPRWYFHERVVDLPVRLTTDIPGFRKQYMYRYIETQLLINWQQVGTFCKETPKEAWHLRLPPSWNTWTPSNWPNVWAHFTFEMLEYSNFCKCSRMVVPFSHIHVVHGSPSHFPLP